MCGPPQSCKRIVRLFLGKPGYYRVTADPNPTGVAVLGTVEDLERWRILGPEDLEGVRVDPSGIVVLRLPPS